MVVGKVRQGMTGQPDDRSAAGQTIKVVTVSILQGINLCGDGY